MNVTPAMLADVLATSGNGLVWKRTIGQRAQAGKPAGSLQPNGYVRVRVFGVLFLAHRVVWAIHTGEWPVDQIDHVNGNRADNSVKNLREATHAQNQANTLVRKNNAAGIKGVHKRGNKWLATIREHERLVIIGRFVTPEEAAAAYLAASKSIHGEFAGLTSRGKAE